MSKTHRVLVQNEKYQGKYVVFDPSGGNKVIASSSNLCTVIKKARQQGIELPAIVFVPKKDVAYIY